MIPNPRPAAAWVERLNTVVIDNGCDCNNCASTRLRVEAALVAYAREQVAAALERTNVLKNVNSDWEHTDLSGEVKCHSRMVEGVLCRWWGDSIPPGVVAIDAAAIRALTP